MSLVRIAIVIIMLNFVRYCEFADLEPYEVNINRPPFSKIKACGIALAEWLSSVCGGVYNGKKRSNIKPNSIVPDTDYIYNYESYPDTELGFPFRPKRVVSSLLRTIRLKREEKIVDECCKKSCSVQEMMGYCG